MVVFYAIVFYGIGLYRILLYYKKTSRLYYKYVCTHVPMFVCMYVCMYVYNESVRIQAAQIRI